MKYFLFLGVLIYIFMSSSVAAKLGIEQVGTFSSLILVFLFCLKFLNDSNNQLFLNFKEEFHIVLAGFFIVLIKIIIGQADQLNMVIFFLIVPMLISILIGTQNRADKKTIQYLILFFFVTECLLAIYERIFLVNIFPYISEIEESSLGNWSFRSSAFLGFPLSNALCVSIIMGFILTSSIKISFKLFYVILGFISLLCFNARAAIFIWIVLLSTYLINFIFHKKTKQNVALSMTVFFLSAIYLLFHLIVDYGFGGRIINDKINDGSAQTRLEVFDSFSYINDSDLWFGNAANYNPIMKKLGAGGVENSYIVLIINFGIPIFIFLIPLFYRLIKRFLKPYTLFHKLIILTSFLLVGSANNALAGAMPWGFLILCFYTFSEVNYLIVKRKSRLLFNLK